MPDQPHPLPCPREITQEDMDIARRVARGFGPPNDGEVESAAMTGLLDAARLFDGRGDWKRFMVQRVKFRCMNLFVRNLPLPVETLPEPKIQPPEETNPLLTEALSFLDPELAEEILYSLDRRKSSHRQALETIRLHLTST